MCKRLYCDEVIVFMPPSLKTFAVAEIINHNLHKKFDKDEEIIFNRLAEGTIVQLVCKDWSREDDEVNLRSEVKRGENILSFMFKHLIVGCIPYYNFYSNERRFKNVKRRLFY